LFDDDDANAFGAAGDLLQIGHNPNLIPTSIRSDQPVQDFWAMVGNGERDLTDTAMLQMGEMIPRLLNEGTEVYDPQVAKAMACLREMRAGAMQEDVPEKFNETLHKLRQLYRDGPSGRVFIWDHLRSADSHLRGGLISASEHAHSTVSDEDKAAFWTQEASGAALSDPTMPGASVEEDVANDIDLDALE